MTDSVKKQIFKVGAWTVDPSSREINNGQQQHRLPPRLMSLLCKLADHPRETISRDELVEHLWHGRPVNEEALSRSIAELRAALGDDSKQPTYIETIPKLGYRLLAEISHPNPIKRKLPAPLRLQNILLWSTAVLIGVIALTLLLQGFWKKRSEIMNVDTDPLILAKRITSAPGMEHQASISPNGHMVAYVSSGHGERGIYLLSPDDPDQPGKLPGTKVQLSPTFSPDGNYLAYVEFENDQCVVKIFSLYDDDRRRISDCNAANYSPLVDWSRQGDLLAITDNDEQTGSPAIWTVNLETGERIQQTYPPGPYIYDTNPRFSADGRVISFTRGTKAVRELYILDIAGDQLRAQQITFNRQYILGHDWSMDGRWIVFDSDHLGHRSLWKVDPLTLETQILGARGAEAPAIASETNRVVFQVSEFEANIWQKDLTTDTAFQPLIQSTKYDTTPMFSSDGQLIAFSSNREQNGALWVANSNGQGVRKLYASSEGRAIWPSWSPDNSELLFTLYTADGQRIMRLDMESKTVSEVPGIEGNSYGGQYSKDGQWIYYIAIDNSGNTQGRKVDVFSGARGELPDLQMANRIMPIDDGILFTRNNGKAIWHLKDESEPTLLEGIEILSGDWDAWTSQGGYVYYAKREGDRGLWRMSLTDGTQEKIDDWLPTAFGPSLAVSPDLQKILMVRRDRAETDLFLWNL